jgi:hypothetical protein
MSPTILGARRLRQIAAVLGLPRPARLGPQEYAILYQAIMRKLCADNNMRRRNEWLSLTPRQPDRIAWIDEPAELQDPNWPDAGWAQ